MINPEIVVFAGAAACFAGCIGDFLSLFILGSKYPGYRHVSDPISFLGSSESPVSHLISVFWVVLGVLIIIFGIGFRTAYMPADLYVKIASWLIILYGLGEGLGSGMFKADQVNNSYTVSFIIHDILGGAGVVALLVLMLVVPKIKEFSVSRAFFIFSNVSLILAVFLLILFSQRFIGSKYAIAKGIAKYTGLWQRLLLLDFYVYLLTLAVKMVAKTI